MFDYHNVISLPDSAQNKIISVLNDYLPPQIVIQAQNIDKVVMQNIEQTAKAICGNDSTCTMKTKDSIIKQTTESQLFIFRQFPFPANFILSIGNWNVQIAEPILLKNINNTKYPHKETQLALAKLGNDSIKQIIISMYNIDYVLNHSIYKTGNPNLLYTNATSNDLISNIINDFYNTAIYIEDKNILFNMIDLLDIEGKESLSENFFDNQGNVYVSNNIQPIEESILMWLSNLFIERKYIENGSLDEWDLITNTYFSSIDRYKNAEQIKDILSKENKLKIKTKLKKWIEKNVNFEN
jgi:hypothetical protein